MPSDRLFGDPVAARSGRDLDRADLVGGVLSVLLAGCYLLDDLTSVHVSPLSVWVALLAVLGIAVVAAGLRRRPTPHDVEPSAPPD